MGYGGLGAFGGGGGAEPASCALEHAEPGPYPVTFRFENTGPATVYLEQGCELEFTVSSCEGLYRDSLTISALCSADCATPANGCPVCGACPDAPLAVDPGEFVDYQWDRRLYSFSRQNGCSCHTTTPAPAGLYRVEIPVYASEADIAAKRPIRQGHADFTLPMPGQVVWVGIPACLGLCE